MRLYLVLLLCLLAACASESRIAMPPPAEPGPRSVPAELEQWTQSSSGADIICVYGAAITSAALLATFYRGRAYAPVWLDPAGNFHNAKAILDLLEKCAAEGLRPEDYHVAEIKTLLATLANRSVDRDPALAPQAAKLELLVTDAFFTFTTHIAVGRAPLEARDGGVYDPRKVVHLDELLIHALSQDQALEFTRSWFRTDPLYLGLKTALQHYRDLAARQNWPAVPAGKELKLGDRDPLRIPLLKKRLAAFADYSASASDDSVWDSGLQAAVKQFQSRCQLPPTGRLTPDTLSALNRPLADVIRQLEVNLERWRWLPRDLGDKYILVNIPSFHLAVKAGGHSVMTMKVVVGKELHHTPVFASKIASVVINPSWMIPAQIILKEKLRSIRRDPGFFERNHITVITGWGGNAETIDPATVDWRNLANGDYYKLYRFQQEPGPWNALGRIKFILPNPYNIYLHDTPQRGLFGEPVRTFSHGCIRLEKPIPLAEYLLDDPRNWSREGLTEAIDANYEQTVDLPSPVAIYVTYMTSSVEADGLLHFYPDIYGQDRDLLSAWEQPPLNPCAP